MVIGKIREKSTLLLIMIGGAMLAFILGDLLNSGSFILNGSPTDIGE
ncbi:MAG: SurA N-terminal domain-containing protein [Flavobacteriales bacterium]|nr:SurA N-terminal domain-containing protein [Flavobacteriales bacterium]